MRGKAGSGCGAPPSLEVLLNQPHRERISCTLQRSSRLVRSALVTLLLLLLLLLLRR
jgi:hypothetical protein